MHHRFTPKVHHFEHRIFMFYLDLDELPSLGRKSWLFGHNRRSVYSFRDGDHQPAGKNPLKERLVSFLRTNRIDAGPLSRVMLLTLPRVFGYIFNPISIYYCYGSDNKPLCAVAEVGNTFGEKKLYLLSSDDFDGRDSFHKVTPKNFYVSPFSPLDLNFDFQLRIPQERLEIKIDDYDGAQKTLISTLSGKRAAFTKRNLFWFTLKYPLITLKVISLIHWHALLLWLKRVPFHSKAHNPAGQREVLQPHSTPPLK